MAERLTAMVAYRHPRKHVFWDKECTDRVGAMREGKEGKLQIQRYDNWVELDEDYILYADPSAKKLWTSYYQTP